MKIIETVQNRDVFLLDDKSGLWIAGMMIDGDGAGGNAEGDPDWQSTTSLRHADGSFLNLRTESVIVVPPEVLYGFQGRVLGCKAEVRNLTNGLVAPAVVGETGPHGKLGEASIHTASLLQVPSNPRTGGNSLAVFAYRIWPDVPAPGYQLQHA
jgi:hypothetical protein